MKRFARPFRWLASTSLMQSLRVRLILLVLVATLPSLGLLVLTAAQQRDDAIAAGQDETARIARLTAASQSNVSRQIELVLATIAVLPAVRGDDRASCTHALRSISSPSGEPAGLPEERDVRVDGATFVRVAVVDSEGDMFCTSAFGGASIPPADRMLAEVTGSIGLISAGNIHVSQAGSMLITYAAPVTRDDGQGRRVILATLEVYALASFAREARLPTGTSIVVVARDGTVEQQYPSAETELVGLSLAGTPVVDMAIGIPTLVPVEGDDTDSRDAEDVPQVIGVDDFWTPGADGRHTVSYVLVSVPESVVVQRASEIFNENLGKLAIAAVVALLAAWIGADLFGSRDTSVRKGLVRDLYDAFATGSSTARLDEIVGPHYMDRTASPGQADGLDGLRQNIAAFQTSFPDGRIEVRELLAERDKVIARVSLIGTHVSDFGSVPASGELMTADGVETFRFEDGMIAESWSMFSSLRPTDALAATPLPPAPLPSGSRWWQRLLRRRGQRVEEVSP